MNSPLFDALSAHIAQNRERLYMPGHKGSLPYPLNSCAPFDVTELELTGCLYDGEGAPLEVENRFSKLYQSGSSLLSTGGSTLCIQTMLSLFCPVGSGILMDRNAHHSAVNACALLDLHPQWLLSDEPSGVLTPGRISAEAVESALKVHGFGISAVYITSPTYFGTLQDISAISEVCRRYNKPLLVDNAHGAHLKFFKGLHPIEAGADCCCDSLHKTLPALTGGALLHLKDGRLKSEARRRMKQFGSTSPSYLIMLSCDMIIPRWNQLREDFLILAEKLSAIKDAARQKGVLATDESCLNDPARISLLFPEGGRDAASKLLKKLKAEAEYISPRHIVLLPSVKTDLSVIENIISELAPLDETASLPQFSLPEQLLPPRTAALSCAETVNVQASVGRTAAAPIAPCPPGAALVMPGEKIDQRVISELIRYGVTELSVTL